MADNKKYYYLKLKENFYDSDAMILLESMENGYLYSNILMKMYLRSLKTDGKLMINGTIPYHPQLLAKVLRHNSDVVDKAIGIFKQLGLIEILDNGAIYMLDIQNYIGKSSTEADRKRLYREQIVKEKQLLISDKGQMSGQVSPVCSREIEKEIDIELKKEKNKKEKNDKFTKPTIKQIDDYCKERNNNVRPEEFYDFYESKGWKVGKSPMKDWKACVRTWERRNKTSETNYEKNKRLIDEYFGEED